MDKEKKRKKDDGAHYYHDLMTGDLPSREWGPELEEFDFVEKWLSQQGHYSIFICGGRHSGKTTLLRYLWPGMRRRYDLVIFFCHNPQAGIYEFLGDHDQKFVFESYQSRILSDLFQFQKDTHNLLEICVVFDDCSSTRTKYSDEIMQMFIRGRNVNMTVVVSTQALTLLRKESRTNVDYLCLLDPKTNENCEKVVECFMHSAIPKPPGFRNWKRGLQWEWECQYVKDHVRDHGILVVDYRDTENPEKVYQFKVPSI